MMTARATSVDLEQVIHLALIFGKSFVRIQILPEYLRRYRIQAGQLSKVFFIYFAMTALSIIRTEKYGVLL
jgi:hypothetical protein